MPNFVYFFYFFIVDIFVNPRYHRARICKFYHLEPAYGLNTSNKSCIHLLQNVCDIWYFSCFISILCQYSTAHHRTRRKQQCLKNNSSTTSLFNLSSFQWLSFYLHWSRLVEMDTALRCLAFCVVWIALRFALDTDTAI